MVGGCIGNGYRHRRQAFGYQDCQVEHAQPDRDREQPSVHLAGNTIKADHSLFHPSTV
jgi:hypothetical protein